MPGIRFTKKNQGSALTFKGYYADEMIPPPLWNWDDDPVKPGMEIKAAHVQSIRENLKEKVDAIRKKLIYCSCTCDTTCNCQCQCTCTCTCTCNWIF